MIAAVVGALAIGLSLGLLGSGGSILTVPVLTLLLGQPDKVAIAGSLFVVGTVALASALAAARRGSVDMRSVALFGGPGMVGTWIGSRLAAGVPGAVQLALFAGVALVAATLMLRPPRADAHPRAPRPTAKLVGDGLAVGVMTGFVGVGGGFLIVPALVLLAGLEPALATGTSLAIIAVNSAVGFLTHLGTLRRLGLALDWPTLLLIAAVGVVGGLAGRALAPRLAGARFRRAFAVFLLLVAIVVLARSLAQLG